MKRLMACALLLAGIYGCERICGDLQPVAATTMGGAGAGGEGVTAGEGGAPPVPPVGGAGGMPSEGGGDVGGAAGAAGGVGCSAPPNASIIDFEDAPPSPALGEMVSDKGDPADAILSEMGLNKAYHEGGGLPDTEGNGFTFRFEPCVDASDYAAIRFEARGATPAGIDVSIPPASASDSSIHFEPQRTAKIPVCVPVAEDQKTLRELRFNYAPRGSANPEVDLYLDNFVFSPDPCP
jgi:hypothetical protein